MEITELLTTAELDYPDLEALAPSVVKAVGYGINGLLTDGGHHKQWIIERMLEALGIDLTQLQRLREWDEGIAP